MSNMVHVFSYASNTAMSSSTTLMVKYLDSSGTDCCEASCRRLRSAEDESTTVRFIMWFKGKYHHNYSFDIPSSAACRSKFSLMLWYSSTSTYIGTNFGTDFHGPWTMSSPVLGNLLIFPWHHHKADFLVLYWNISSGQHFNLSHVLIYDHIPAKLVTFPLAQAIFVM